MQYAVKRLSIVFLTLSVLIGCSTQKTDSASGQSEKDVKKSAIVSEHAVTTLILDDGSAKGASVALPPQAISAGSTLTLNRVNDPDQFYDASVDSSNIASSAIKVEATSSSGEPITELASPMTLAIPYTSSDSSLSAVDRIDKNLCVYLYSIDDQLLVWHANSISIFASEGLAKFTSNKLGTFQLFFCGPDTPSSFAEASDTKVASTPPSNDVTATDSSFGSQVTFTLTMDASAHEFSGKFCLVAGYSPSSSGQTDKAMGAVEYSLSSTALALGFNTYRIPDSAKPFILLLVQKSSQSCSVIVDGDLDMFPDHFQAFRFDVTKLGLTKGTADGTFGSGIFATKRIGLQASAPNGEVTQMSPMPAKDLCIVATSYDSDTEVGSTQINTSVDTAGKIGGLEQLSFEVPTGESSTTTQRLNIKVGEDCMSNTEVFDENSEPYRIQARTPVSDVFYMMAISLKTTSNLYKDKFCTELYNGSYSVGIPTVASTKLRLGQWLIDPTATYKIYMPYDSTDLNGSSLPVYDLRYVQGTCSSSYDSTTGVMSNHKVLTQDFKL